VLAQGKPLSDPITVKCATWGGGVGRCPGGMVGAYADARVSVGMCVYAGVLEQLKNESPD